AGRGEQVAIFGEDERSDLFAMTLKRPHHLGAVYIPDANCVVSAAGHESASVRADGERADQLGGSALLGVEVFKRRAGGPDPIGGGTGGADLASLAVPTAGVDELAVGCVSDCVRARAVRVSGDNQLLRRWHLIGGINIELAVAIDRYQ